MIHCQPEPPDSSYMGHLGRKILEPTYIFGFLLKSVIFWTKSAITFYPDRNLKIPRDTF